jgi:dethiobiotin synthetase
MSGPILYVTGTNTGVGKTTLATLLLRGARERNIKVAALKPFCSGDREDAERLHALQSAGFTLDEVNPFYFTEPLAPLVAARRASRSIPFSEVLTAFDRTRKTNLPLLIEGAGGLLSPLGEGYSLYELITERPGKMCVVAENTLGVLNLILLTISKLNLPSDQQCVVLMNPKKATLASETNIETLSSLLKQIPIHSIPFLNDSDSPPNQIDTLLEWWLR